MDRSFASLAYKVVRGIAISRQGPESIVGVATKRLMSATSSQKPPLRLPESCRKIEAIPSQVRDFTAEAASKIVKVNPLLIIDPQVIAAHSQALSSIISSLKSEDAREIERVLRDFALRKCSAIYITDDIGRLSSKNLNIDLLSPSVIEMLRDKIGIDNLVTSRQETMEAVIESSPNILFYFAALNATGFGFPNTKERPLFCFRTTHNQDGHRDSIGSSQSKALALYGISATGEVKTFYVELDRIIEILTPQEIEFLMKPIFYHGDLDDFSQSPKKTFPVLKKNLKGNFEIMFDANKGAIAVLGDIKDFERLNEIRNRINAFVEDAITQESILNVGIATSQGLVVDNARGLHGRQQRIDGKKINSEDELSYHNPSLKTSSNSERRVLRMLSGSFVPLPKDEKSPNSTVISEIYGRLNDKFQKGR